ncbi:cysteine/glutathione ABC transporter membrane/ATP-binding component (plasmid) [Streptococcus dysgalactiae]|uniref:hypothetical protein n=1 Tax=Streptococcus dysgalactiae TaxID=1334 RepID=UPI000DCA99EC|nr:cysteine/glutathione ABC transporter membrane/ATP-binding component [Streptococcus dysgalactiae]
MQPALMLVSYLAVYVSIYMVSGMVETDPTVIGNIASFMTYMMQIMFSIIMVGFMGMQASRAFVSIGRLKEVLNTEPAMTFDTEQEEEVSGSIVFEDVSFTYLMMMSRPYAIFPLGLNLVKWLVLSVLLVWEVYTGTAYSALV